MKPILMQIWCLCDLLSYTVQTQCAPVNEVYF